MEIQVNGKKRNMEAPATLSGFLAQSRLSPQWVIVELNGEVIARDRFSDTPLKDGDRLEIIQAAAGG